MWDAIVVGSGNGGLAAADSGIRCPALPPGGVAARMPHPSAGEAGSGWGLGPRKIERPLLRRDILTGVERQWVGYGYSDVQPAVVVTASEGGSRRVVCNLASVLHTRSAITTLAVVSKLPHRL